MTVELLFGVFERIGLVPPAAGLKIVASVKTRGSKGIVRKVDGISETYAIRSL